MDCGSRVLIFHLNKFNVLGVFNISRHTRHLLYDCKRVIIIISSFIRSLFYNTEAGTRDEAQCVS